MMRGDAGFSLIEMVVALALTATALAAVFTAIDPAHGAFATEPEIADMQQRLRVAAHVLASDLISAGARSAVALPLPATAPPFPAVLPYRAGPLNAGSPAAAAGDVITVLSVPPQAGETTIQTAIRGPVAVAIIAGPSGCVWTGSGRDPSCGLRPGVIVLVRDEAGFDLFTVAALAGNTVTLEQVRNVLVRPFDAGSRIVEVALTTYYLRADEQAKTYQLMRYNGRSSDAPVVDHVVALEFEYSGEVRGGAAGVVPLAPAEVAQDPPPTVRHVGIKLRVQAASESLRGPAGVLFRHGGSSRQARRWVPDLETTIGVALRNAGLGP
jgi:prepilin-type N-terminal cleavage/methylation domain-containing protein